MLAFSCSASAVRQMAANSHNSVAEGFCDKTSWRPVNVKTLVRELQDFLVELHFLWFISHLFLVGMIHLGPFFNGTQVNLTRLADSLWFKKKNESC